MNEYAPDSPEKHVDLQVLARGDREIFFEGNYVRWDGGEIHEE